MEVRGAEDPLGGLDDADSPHGQFQGFAQPHGGEVYGGPHPRRQFGASACTGSTRKSFRWLDDKTREVLRGEGACGRRALIF